MKDMATPKSALKAKRDAVSRHLVSKSELKVARREKLDRKIQALLDTRD